MHAKFNGLWQHIQDRIDTQLNDIMNKTYQKLNKKLDSLTKHTRTTQRIAQKEQPTQARVINLTNTKFTKEQMDTLALGPNYATEKEPKHYINELIIDTENAIRQLEPKVQDTFRHLATRKIKQIATANMQNSLHKRQQHTINHATKQSNYCFAFVHFSSR
jgi:hypothetical protein